ncbi:MAG: hypothetical protein WB492_14440 [Christiangramia sp.]
MSTKEKHLYYLTELKDYKVNSKDPDIRGWEVKDLDNRVIGKVDNLLVNKDLGKVVYVDVEVDESIIDRNHDPYAATTNSVFREFINKEGENHIIIPIGLIELSKNDKYVFTDSINYQTFAETKRYKSGTAISRDYERHVMDSYDRRKKYSDKDSELNRTASAYSDEEMEERDMKRNEEIHHREEFKTKREPTSELDEKIRREKEHLKYKSGDRNRRDREDENVRSQTTSGSLNPERTLDEDNDWAHDESRFENENTHEEKRSGKKYEDDFYDRKEFYDREHH